MMHAAPGLMVVPCRAEISASCLDPTVLFFFSFYLIFIEVVALQCCTSSTVQRCESAKYLNIFPLLNFLPIKVSPEP